MSAGKRDYIRWQANERVDLPDLKAMQRNRNIPGALKRQVKALIDQRAKKR